MGHKQRYRAGKRETVPGDDFDYLKEGNTEGGVEVELEDANQEELAPEKPSSTPAIQDKGEDEPLEVLKRQFQEAQAERDAERKRAEAAEARAREQESQLGRHATNELSNHKAVLEQAYSTEELKVKDAKRRYALALQEGNFDAAADAQEEMVRSNGIMSQYANAYQELERREREPKPVAAPPVQDQFEAALATMHPKVASWAREHRDDVLKPERQKLAYAADQMAAAKGFMPGTDEYLDFLDEQMGYLEPDAEPDERPAQHPVPAKTARRAPSAPPSRTSGSAPGRRRVYLTEDEKMIAQSMGISLEAYAASKERTAGSKQPSNGSGRTYSR